MRRKKQCSKCHQPADTNEFNHCATCAKEFEDWANTPSPRQGRADGSSATLAEHKSQRDRSRRRRTASWNHPAGTEVEVTQDDGSVVRTRTRSTAWPLGDGTLVVLLEGRTGGFAVDRVRKVELPCTG